jgi:hypothetical protein
VFKEGKGWEISTLFERYAFDLENWTMDEGFFVAFEEMKFDIPCSASKTANEKCGSWEEEVWDCMPMTA